MTQTTIGLGRHYDPLQEESTQRRDAEQRPALPLEGYELLPSECAFVPTEEEQELLTSLSVTLEEAHEIEERTREQSHYPKWHERRRTRVTASTFREVCHFRSEETAESGIKRIIQTVNPTEDMQIGLKKEPKTIAEYEKLMNVTCYPCGLVIHPDAPWLAASPDGVVFDRDEKPTFGLVEVTSTNKKKFAECDYIEGENEPYRLRENSPHYWQVQGQLLITGMQWCDFVVWAKDDYLILRIRTDERVQGKIREKVDPLFFYKYMRIYLSWKRE